MPLHLTKVAFGVTKLEDFVARWAAREGLPPYELGTRYLPKRHEEICGPDAQGGSLFWVLKHTLVARSRIVGFGELEGGRVSIKLDPRLVLVQARPKRAHQGWRYLEGADAPLDLGEGAIGGDAMPAALIGKLAALGLV
jgi:hypothetical protein